MVVYSLGMFFFRGGVCLGGFVSVERSVFLYRPKTHRRVGWEQLLW